MMKMNLFVKFLLLTFGFVIEKKIVQLKKMSQILITALVKQGITPKIKNKIIKFISEDEILPRLEISPEDISVMKSTEMISVTIGPRDFDFDLDGNWIGSGTMMKDVVWKKKILDQSNNNIIST